MHSQVNGRYQLYLLHRSEHLITTPFRESPVVIILLHTTDANGAIGAAASTQKSSSGKTAFFAVETWLGRGDNIPVKWSVVTLGPTIVVAASTEVWPADTPISTYAPGICTFSTSALSEPASRMRTLTFGSSERRPATTGPQVPPLKLMSFRIIGLQQRGCTYPAIT